MDKELQTLVQSLPALDWHEGENIYHEFEGYYFEPHTTNTTLEMLKTWEVRQDDTFVLSYPKAGNHWMLQIINLILNDGDAKKANETHVSFRVPFLEMSPVKHCSQVSLVPSPPLVIDKLPSPRFIKTHLPHKILPRQIWDMKPKVIYVARNPKDLVVSYYHFSKYNLTMPDFASFGEFLEEFCSARLYGGHYLDEAKFWWDKRHQPNVLFIKYEDMKQDLRSSVVKVAHFINHPLSKEAIESVVINSDFKKMKQNSATNPDEAGHFPPHKKMLSFMRRGTVGDWKRHFTVEQNDAFNAYYEENMNDTTLTFDFQL